MTQPLRVALCQIAPVLLDREATLEKVEAALREAARQGAGLAVFGEALVPGYPVWVERTDGARFDHPDQKAFYAAYAEAAVQPEAGHMDGVCALAREQHLAVCLGTIERAADRGGKSLYCSRIFVLPDGSIGSVHRKLVPTYEERLTWAPGDGHGLVVHPVGPFTVGALNCWENWMPLARTALHAQGEDLHLAIWPGSRRNTHDITRFLAKEGRSFVVSVSGLLRARDVPDDFPHRERIAPSPDDVLCDGGSCVAAPDGSWVLEPRIGEEGTYVVELDPALVRRERQNFDPVGHYARPDVLRLRVDRTRQGVCEWT